MVARLASESPSSLPCKASAHPSSRCRPDAAAGPSTARRVARPDAQSLLTVAAASQPGLSGSRMATGTEGRCNSWRCPPQMGRHTALRHSRCRRECAQARHRIHVATGCVHHRLRRPTVPVIDVPAPVEHLALEAAREGGKPLIGPQRPLPLYRTRAARQDCSAKCSIVAACIISDSRSGSMRSIMMQGRVRDASGPRGPSSWARPTRAHSAANEPGRRESRW